MQFITRLSRWALSGPRAWISIIFAVFIVLLFVYNTLVTSTENPEDYTLPSAKNKATNSKSEAAVIKINPIRIRMKITITTRWLRLILYKTLRKS